MGSLSSKYADAVNGECNMDTPLVGVGLGMVYIIRSSYNLLNLYLAVEYLSSEASVL